MVNVFDLSRFKGDKKTFNTIVGQFLFADDAAFCATSEEDLQTISDVVIAV